MTDKKLQHKTALVTGASSGIGEALARELAAHGCNLILTARREERLVALQEDIMTKHDVIVDVFMADLAQADAPQKLYDQISEAGHKVNVLINNAGFGQVGEFAALDPEGLHNMLMLNVVALTNLTRLFVNDIIANGPGYIMLVGSTGSFQASPMYSSYAASKSYVLSLGNALNYELRNTGVNCIVLCPGTTASEFHDVAGQQLSGLFRATLMTSAEVAEIGVRAMLNKRSTIVTGRLNAVLAAATRITPRALMPALAARFAANGSKPIN